MVRKLVQDLPIKVRKNMYTKLNLTGSFEIKKNRGVVHKLKCLKNKSLNQNNQIRHSSYGIIL